MTGIDDLDLLLSSHYGQAADVSASESQIASVLRAVATTPQRRGIVGWRPAARTPQSSTRARGPYRVLGLAALLVLGSATTALLVGSALRRSPEPSPRVYQGVFESIDPLTDGSVATGLIPVPDGGALLITRPVANELAQANDLLMFDSDGGTFTRTGTLQVHRREPSSVQLDDGRVLIVGSGDELIENRPAPAAGYRAELVDPVHGTSVLTGPTAYRHTYGSSATLLDDGRVLIAGGDGSTGPAELYDPTSNTFAAVAPMSRDRTRHAAVRLLDGRVLIVGGTGSEDGETTAELFDPATETFIPAGPMVVPQDAGFSASLLADGRVLIVGGWLADGSMTAEAQIFDPTDDTFTKIRPLPAARAWHSSAALADGRVLIVGGFGENQTVEDSDTALVYDPGTGRFTATESMTARRLGPLMGTLADGRVLVVGSQCRNMGCYGLGDDYAGMRSAEVYD